MFMTWQIYWHPVQDLFKHCRTCVINLTLNVWTLHVIWQVASLSGCLVVLVVIVAVGPLFYHLPQVGPYVDQSSYFLSKRYYLLIFAFLCKIYLKRRYHTILGKDPTGTRMKPYIWHLHLGFFPKLVNYMYSMNGCKNWKRKIFTYMYITMQKLLFAIYSYNYFSYI